MLHSTVALSDLDAQLGAGGRFATSHVTRTKSTRVPQFILCPSCGRRLRMISKSDIYECKECRVFVTEPDERHYHNYR